LGEDGPRSNEIASVVYAEDFGGAGLELNPTDFGVIGHDENSYLDLRKEPGKMSG
jgi:hypothetical protein